MSLDGSSILASLLVSGVGFVVFSYGRKQVRLPQIVLGIVLMVFPYFVPGALPMLGIAGLILAVLWGVVQFGW